MLLMVAMLPIASCSKDEPDDKGYYDFSIVWEVIDKGDYTTAEAKSLAAEFTNECEDIFEGYTVEEAKEDFEEFCRRLRYELSTGYMEITLQAILVRNEGNKKISSKKFYIKPEGTTINKPGQPTRAEVIVE